MNGFWENVINEFDEEIMKRLIFSFLLLRTLFWPYQRLWKFSVDQLSVTSALRFQICQGKSKKYFWKLESQKVKTYFYHIDT